MAMRRSLPAIVLIMLALAGSAVSAAPRRDWQGLILQRDRTRLHDWRRAWSEALAQARAAGEGARIDAEGALLRPDAALDAPAPPDGEYRCRIIKLGAREHGRRDFVAMPGFHCRIADGALRTLDGPQRPGGRLYPLDAARMVFLGALAVGDEAGTLGYGRDPDRDEVGVIERVAPARWRLVLPYPRWESLLDVVELVPLA